MTFPRPGSRGAAMAAGSILAVLSILLPRGVAAQEADRLAELEAQVAALMAEVQSLKAEQAHQAAQVQAVAQQAAAPAPMAAPAQRPVAVNAALAGDVAAAELSPNELPQPVVQTRPSPGIDGQPFFVPQPEGRKTGVMTTGNDKVRVTFSGQINRALNYVDDGIDSDLYQVDNENASSRFRFLGESSPLNEWQAVSLFEFEWPTNGSLDVNQIQPVVPDSMNQVFNLRLLEVGFANNNWGSFFIGQGWMASDGTSEIDISGITTPGWAGQTFAYGGMLPTVEDGEFKYQPRNPGSVPQRSDYTSEEAYQSALDSYASSASNFVNVFGFGNDLDGLSRQKRVRYNTPIMAGLQFSTSAGTEDLYDGAIRYAGSTSWARIAAAVSYWTYAVDADEGGYDGWSGSASLLLAGTSALDGLSFTVSAAKQDFEADGRSDPEQYFGKIAYVNNYLNIGRTGFAAMYGSYTNFLGVDQEMELVTLAISQNIDPLGTEIYAGWTGTTFDAPDIDYNDMSVWQFGAMVRF